MEKTSHNPYWNHTTEQEGQLSEKWPGSQNSLDEMEETGCLDNLSVCHRFGLYVWVGRRKPLLRKANMKSLSLLKDIWGYILHLRLFVSREKLDVWYSWNKAFQTKWCPRIDNFLELPEHELKQIKISG